MRRVLKLAYHTECRPALVNFAEELTMKILNQNMTIRDYCAALDRGDIIINRNYQRSDQVWPQMAKSYLIETVILDYPVPKLFLHQATDIRTRQSVKHIVDGQQRTQAIVDFRADRLTLSGALETDYLKGAVFSDLEEEIQQRFLDYGLSIDLFTAAPVDEVIEVFRRMNSYTVPLNPEEKRHAQFQGLFKWFVNSAAKRLQPNFMQLGTFSEKQIIRMLDAKLITEIAHAYFYGISTTNAKKLDMLYKSRNATFDQAGVLEADLTTAVAQLSGWPEIHKGPLTKPYQVYALVLALIHVRRSIPTLESIYASPNMNAIDSGVAIPALSLLADAIEQDDPAANYAEFVDASTSKTNVKAQRETRFRWFCRALVGQVNV